MRIHISVLLYCLAALLCCQTISYAGGRSDKLKPKWLTQGLPESKSGTYIFVSGHGEGATLAGAKQQAFASMSQRLELERGLTVDTSSQIQEQFTEKKSSTSYSYRQEITLDVVEKGHRLEIVCREIDDYWVRRGDHYSVDVLYTVTDKNSYGGSFDDKITVTTKYPGAGFLSIIPGVGQLYKGSTFKGIAIITGEVAAAGAILLCENTRASYVKMMKEQPKYAAEYNTRADAWETGRNIAIGAAAAIYIYNLIDAFATNGAKRVIVEKGRSSLSAVPYVDNHSIGVGLAFRF